jgi:hypothetical protein
MTDNNSVTRIGAACIAVATLMLFTQSVLSDEIDTAEKRPTIFSMGIGWEYLKIGKVELGGKYDYNFTPIPLVSTNEQQSGSLNGIRTDAKLTAPAQLFRLPIGVVNLKGFYAWFNDKSTLDCTSDSLSATCDGTSIIDLDPIGNNTLGSPGGSATYRTNRKVQHWGVALEVAAPDARLAGLQQFFGIAYKAIYQDMDLTSYWPAFANSQGYTETLNTGYAGPYWSGGSNMSLGAGLNLIYGGEAGVYWAHSSYNGYLNQSDFSGAIYQSLHLNRNRATFIAALSLALEKKFQSFALEGYANGEFYSYAPQMAYNQTSTGDGINPAVIISGPNTSTNIRNKTAWAVAAGIRLGLL